MSDQGRLKLFSRQLTALDYAFFGRQGGPVGDSLWVSATLAGTADEESMIYDFSPFKKRVKSLVDELCDHKLLAPKSCLTEESGDSVHMQAECAAGKIEYSAPKVAVCLMDGEVNPDSIRSFLEREILKRLPGNVSGLSIELEKESIPEDEACYHYTHGLRQHRGNCQRLLHGHRSRIYVLQDDNRSPEIEREISEMWRDIHLSALENITDKSRVEPGKRQTHLEQVEISYRSGQGEFRLRMPGSLIYVMEEETTVENIARHLAEVIAKKHPGKIEVVAFEGIDKGASFGV